MHADTIPSIKVGGKILYKIEIDTTLDEIARTFTGRALLHGFRTYTSRTTNILPLFDRLDTATQVHGMEADGTFNGEQQFEPSGPNAGAPDPGTRLGTGVGADAFIFFRRQDWDGSDGPATLPDEVLFHEMVHALRIMGGKSCYRLPVGLRQYQTEEEFFAILLANIYISEKAQGAAVPLRADHIHDPGKVNTTVLPSPGTFHQLPVNIVLIQKLMRQLPMVTTFIANIDEDRCLFNPIREISP
ncbi:hypothetical protein AYO44_03220 [Planctomycetaceae bacterium SCGC AG-212-F19]|nr:hypothetical protein AYO44_03220 [Planctomycetaceae bacterium SCGC AG-212-F19]